MSKPKASPTSSAKAPRRTAKPSGESADTAHEAGATDPADPAGATATGPRDRSGPVSIKKYANRRLYNTGTSTYVTLDDLSRMVRRGEDFNVTDARSGENITRSVLAQIIFEQESKGQTEGANLLPLSVMRQLIRFYGDSMQSMVPKYLEYSMDALDRDQEKFRKLGETMTGALGAKALGTGTLTAIEERTRKNMEMFTHAMKLFNPFAALQEQANRQAQPRPETPPAATDPEPTDTDDDLSALKRQMQDMQDRLEKLSKG